MPSPIVAICPSCGEEFREDQLAELHSRGYQRDMFGGPAIQVFDCNCGAAILRPVRAVEQTIVDGPGSKGRDISALVELAVAVVVLAVSAVVVGVILLG